MIRSEIGPTIMTVIAIERRVKKKRRKKIRRRKENIRLIRASRADQQQNVRTIRTLIMLGAIVSSTVIAIITLRIKQINSLRSGEQITTAVNRDNTIRIKSPTTTVATTIIQVTAAVIETMLLLRSKQH